MNKKSIRITLAAVFAFTTTGLVGAPANAAVPLCFGKPATIVGTAGNDFLVGTPGPDVIWGGAGDDHLWGEENPQETEWGAGSADLICGYTGNDGIRGSWGNDKINGGDGKDSLQGDFGADVVQGNAGSDRLRGDYDESGVDETPGDILRGQGGADTLVDFGKGTLEGGPGNDDISRYDCGGGSILRGGGGDDTLEAFWDDFLGLACSASDSADLIYGGNGRDTARVSKLDKVKTTETVTRY